MGVVRYLCITICLVFLAVSSSNAAVANAPTALCNNNGRDAVSGVCLCGSGWGGEVCDTPLLCGANLTATSLTTDKLYPKLDKEFNKMNFTADRLTASIFGPVVKGRTYSDVRFVGQVHSKCGLGTADSVWELSADEFSCADRLALDMSWHDHTNCGFFKQNNITGTNVADDVWEFKATVLISFVDVLATIADSDGAAIEGADAEGSYVERRSSAAFQLYVRFPKFVTVQIEELIVYSEVNMTLAITGFEFDPSTYLLKVTLHTLLNWPNMIRNDQLVNLPQLSVPQGITVHKNGSQFLYSSGGECSTTEYTKCLQMFFFELELNNTKESCNFNGEYVLNATVSTCRANTDSCTWKFWETSFFIVNSYYCGEIVAEPTVTGHISSFSAPSYSPDTATKNFNLGDRAFFKVDLNTENDLNITFVNMWLKPSATAKDPTPSDIYLIQNHELVQQWSMDGGAPMKNPNYPPSFPSIVDLKFANEDGQGLTANVTDGVTVFAPRFSFHLDGWVFRAEPNEHKIYDLKAVVQVTYLGNEYLNGKREIKTRVVDFVWKVDGSEIHASTDFTLTGAEQSAAAVGSSNSNGVNLLAAILPVAGIALVAIVGAVVVAVVIIKRKQATKFTPFN